MKATHISPLRLRTTLIVLYLLLGAVTCRLFYWQVVKSSQLQVAASAQYNQSFTTQGQRGSIYTADGYPLVANAQVYRVFVEPPLLKVPSTEVVALLKPMLLSELRSYQQASESAVRDSISASLEATLAARLNKPDAKWVGLFHPLSEVGKQALEKLQIAGLGFEPYYQRDYPEASVGAQLTGFVGHTDAGEEVGYFGIEGALDKELRGRTERQSHQTDALGWKLLGQKSEETARDGRDVVLTVRRDIQYMAEMTLQKGVERYGAVSGEVVIMDPSTGKILALASYPHYDQKTFAEFPPDLYKNPSVSSAYEPGSTFKTLTVAAGIDSGVIKEDTQCPQCEGPRQIGQYSLKTWNGEYHPQITMTEALAKSDNTAMIFVAEQLGSDKFQEYLKKFGIGERTRIELQEDSSPGFPTKWGPVELATRSFGQGISTTSLQMVKSIAAIANHGVMMRPMLVEKVIDRSTHEEIPVTPQVEAQVIKPETAQTVTKMMVYAAQQGEAKWTVSKTHTVAAKTGTSQIARDGQYVADKTIASFVGFAPPDNPKFIMMVKLVEPSSSIWAAETAAPLWYQIADKLYLFLNIPPDR
jgi:cell division protein FtsI/penicillin-binding protein 2